MTERQHEDRPGLLRRMFRALPAAPSTNYKRPGKSIEIFGRLPSQALVLDIGAKNTGGLYGGVDEPGDATIFCLDIAAQDGVTLVTDAHDMGCLKDGSVDAVISANTFEHLRHPDQAIAEIFRILKPGGHVWISVPFVFPFHADPDDYYRFTHNGLRVLCADFDEIDCDYARGPASTMNHLLVHFFGILFSFNNLRLYSGVTYLSRWLFFWVKYLDYFIGNHQNAHVLGNEAYFLGRKPS